MFRLFRLGLVLCIFSLIFAAPASAHPWSHEAGASIVQSAQQDLFFAENLFELEVVEESVEDVSLSHRSEPLKQILHSFFRQTTGSGSVSFLFRYFGRLHFLNIPPPPARIS